MASRTCILLLFLAINSGYAAPIIGVKYLFSFGDSYTDTGFNITGTKPNAVNPLGNPPFPGVTTDNGLNWIGHLVRTYNTSETLSFNFAVGGATVDASAVKPSKTTIPPVTQQIATFNESVASKPSYAPWKSANSLFAIWIGINDIGNSYTRSGEDTLLTEVLTKYFQDVQLLYSYGGRNFLFLTVPPMNKTPKFLALPASDQATEATLIAFYNSLLKSKAAAFQAANPDAMVWVYDTQVPFNLAISNPTAYGAKSATCSASNGVSCLWWGSYHAGQAIHKLVAHGVATMLNGTFF